MIAALLLAGCAQKPETTAAGKADPAVSPSPIPASTSSPAEAAANAPGPAAPAATAGTGSQVVQAIDNTLGDHAAYRRVIEGLQQAVAAGDAAGVAALVHDPVSVQIAGKTAVLEDPAAFASEYSKMMTPEIAKAITGTRYADVLVNSKGVMLGNGEAWIYGICKDTACKDAQVKLVTLQSTVDPSP